MPHDLNDLTPAFRILAEQLLAQWRAAHPDDPLIITCTLRTLAEQDAAKAAGRSQIRQSKHLPQPPDQLSHALDVCPKSICHGDYSPTSPLWWELGEMAIGLGLRWGGRWDRKSMPTVGKIPPYFYDPGHFELIAEKTPAQETPGGPPTT